ncbi:MULTISPECIES: helix-turn-helix domain-containing protein [Streptomyces]|uniref:Helix-turn-helix domain-containing protein n=2 Tax=Streptomyces TaxID=1883 RepID=A0A7X6I0H0_9ACTN|nr:MULTISPECIES: helix-turn-helix transcriptional regulator [Streptomyces]NJQ07485.1 helix-turn-helix domain-containing protein [Streptomyces lonarensis]NJQ17218.1 helix-turn-helix domain-containing protein [Streptomyces bohaiensis]
MPERGYRTPRQKYGDELRRRRTAAGMTQEALSSIVVCSPTLISHFEAGRRLPNPDDAARIDQALATDGWFARWLKDLERRFADHFTEAAELEQLASVIRHFGSMLVPGILQTPEYAREIFRTGWPNPAGESIDEQVVNRMNRAARLTDPSSPVIWTLLDESVIRRPVGGPTVMAKQLEKIADLAESGRLRLHILPFSTGSHALMEGMLSLMEFPDGAPVAYTENVLTGRLIDDPAQVARCQAMYDLALSDALPHQESVALLRAVAKDYTDEA